MTTAAEFLASLPAPLTLRGASRTTVADVRRTIRVELALAVKAGVIPARTKFSVTGDLNSVRVEITAWPAYPLNETYAAVLLNDALGYPRELVEYRDRPAPFRMSGDARSTRREYTDALNAALVVVETLANRHNFDDSDAMTDYHHCGHYTVVCADNIASVAEQGIRESGNPAMAALVVRARAAADRLGRAAVRSICGRGGIDACGEYALDRLVKLDVRAAGRAVAYDKRRGWVVAEPKIPDVAEAYPPSRELRRGAAMPVKLAMLRQFTERGVKLGDAAVALGIPLRTVLEWTP